MLHVLIPVCCCGDASLHHELLPPDKINVKAGKPTMEQINLTPSRLFARSAEMLSRKVSGCGELHTLTFPSRAQIYMVLTADVNRSFIEMFTLSLFQLSGNTVMIQFDDDFLSGKNFRVSVCSCPQTSYTLFCVAILFPDLFR